MKIVNYDKEMSKIIEQQAKSGVKPSLLLHSCCAPCSTSCIERIRDFFELTVYYYNPNLDSLKEFELRAEEQKRFCESVGISLITKGYNPKEFYDIVQGLENETEGGARCKKCFYLRLKATAEKAKQLGFDYFATTLTVSPLKNATMINELGVKIAEETGVKFLPTDFKKKNGYLRSIELSKEYGLYRQNYCGCEFSKAYLPNG